MKLTSVQAAHWRRCIEAWFDDPTGGLLNLECPSCHRSLHIDGWKKLTTDFVEHEALVCLVCQHETILRSEWLQ